MVTTKPNQLTNLTPVAQPFTLNDVVPTPELDQTIQQLEIRLRDMMTLPQTAKAKSLLRTKIKNLKAYKQRFQESALEAQQRHLQASSGVHYYQDPVTNRQLSFTPKH